MKIVTAKEMQALDRKAIEEHGIPSLRLMENAGLRLFEEIRRFCGGMNTPNLMPLARRPMAG